MQRAHGRSSAPAPAESVEGVVERIVYFNPETYYTVAAVDLSGQRAPVTVVGRLAELNPGETIRATGRWRSHPAYGRQFEVDAYELVLPHTLDGIEKYLGSGLIRGIGPTFARRLVEHFGAETLEIIDQRSAKLREVDGIGPRRLENIRAAWAEQRAVRDVMIFLQEHGVGTAHAAKIYKAYGGESVALVRANPYRLAEDIQGIGFVTADRIAGRLGVAPTSPDRIGAGIEYALQQAAGEGHVCLPQENLVEEASRLLGLPPETVEPILGERMTSRRLIRDLIPEPRVYLPGLLLSEVHAARILRLLATTPARLPPIQVERAIEWAEARAGVAYAAAQREALRTSLTSPVTVITGGPGVGKTTLVRALVDILTAKRAAVLLVSPTGRGAKRLSEAGGVPAQTIHRALGYQPRTRSFSRGQDSPVDAAMVIVDETSMLDQVLAYHLLKAIRPATTLVLVGDPDQLPSVGPGNVLADIIASGICPVVRLEQVYRQTGDSQILDVAHKIRRGEAPELARAAADTDFFFVSRSDPQEVAAMVVELATRRIPERFGLDPLRDVQVLSPMHRGPCGVTRLNQLIQERLQPDRGAALFRSGYLWRRGDKVMQVRNNYDLDVYNGDIGFVTDINTIDQRVTVEIDGRGVAYDFAELDELVPAYAISVHKAQGSEYAAVVVPVVTGHAIMLRRNLLYTAVTRARRLLVLVGSARAVHMALRNVFVEERFTGLRARLERAALAAPQEPQPELVFDLTTRFL